MEIMFNSIILKAPKNRVTITEIRKKYERVGFERAMRYIKEKYVPKGLKIIDDTETVIPPSIKDEAIRDEIVVKGKISSSKAVKDDSAGTNK